MSHTTTMRDVPLREGNLRAAIAEMQRKGLQGELLEDTEARYYAGNRTAKLPLVLRLPGSYDVGFSRNEDGTLSPVFDGWAGHVKKHLGVDANGLSGTDRSKASIGRLLQEYSKQVTIETATSGGQVVSGITEPDSEGAIYVELDV